MIFFIKVLKRNVYKIFINTCTYTAPSSLLFYFVSTLYSIPK